ncbi:hypothetical protein QBC40DRAFT_35454 [Triangularia verruculosa]|uniref:Uncharacterized protein n=1 Tax=Triangularia verruculosa TaxID=2587418 RepID=A0AAN7AP60_9PEZI|nr:hypothetical protein QBC40DRAFT_35454 [Triangularia verruculosa]
MRWSGIYIALGLAHLATCSPVPVVLKERLEVFSDAVNGVVTVLQSRSSELSSVISERSQDGSAQTPIEVGSPQLRPLTKHRPAELWSEDDMDAPVIALGDEDLLEVTETEVDITLSTFARPGMPCRQGRIMRENNDMLIIYLATSFLLVVIMVETWGSYMRRQERGEIRLDESPVREVCSIQSDPTPTPAQDMSDEKKSLL